MNQAALALSRYISNIVNVLVQEQNLSVYNATAPPSSVTNTVLGLRGSTAQCSTIA